MGFNCDQTGKMTQSDGILGPTTKMLTRRRQLFPWGRIIAPWDFHSLAMLDYQRVPPVKEAANLTDVKGLCRNTWEYMHEYMQDYLLEYGNT